MLGAKEQEKPMTLPKLIDDRFTCEEGLRVIVQVPEKHSQQIVDAVRAVNALAYGDYDSVTFKTTQGTQQFRSLGTGRNSANKRVVEVQCVELSFFLANDDGIARAVLRAIYAIHPYEEPVVLVQTCARTLHIRGMDEDNPNRFWNRAAEDWVPDEHK